MIPSEANFLSELYLAAGEGTSVAGVYSLKAIEEAIYLLMLDIAPFLLFPW